MKTTYNTNEGEVSTVMVFSILIGSVLSTQAPMPAGEDLQVEIARLVRQLDAPKLAQREAAEAELLGHGPAILKFLPSNDERLPAEVRQRLGRVRQKLQQVAADVSTLASTITLRADKMPLAEILREFQKQSGNTIVDYRRQFGQPVTDPKLSVQFDKTPFWPALDRLLDLAGLTVYPYGQQGAISVIASGGKKDFARVGGARCDGPFRFEPVAVVAKRNLQGSEAGSLAVTVEVSWEPRLRIINLLQAMADVDATDNRHKPLPVADRAAKPEISISDGTSAVKLEVPLRLPSRDAQIVSLKGKLLATIAGRVETFRFDKPADAQNVEQRIAGVTVTLEQARKTAQGCEIHLKVRFDDAGDALASHRQWIFNNPAYLEGPDGKPIAYEAYETTSQSKNEIGIAYRFHTEQPLHGMTFIYQTPGTIVTRAFEYELKEIALP